MMILTTLGCPFSSFSVLAVIVGRMRFVKSMILLHIGIRNGVIHMGPGQPSSFPFFRFHS